MSELELDPTLLATLQTLEAQDVEFVLVGDVAEAIHNNGGFVSGVAIVPGAYSRNVDRLCTALLELEAELGVHGGAAARLDPRADLRDLAPCSFMTRRADVDLDFEPHGTRGYRDLFDDAARIRLAAGVNPLVASRADLARIASGSAPSAPYATAPAALPPEPAEPVIEPADPGIWAGERERIRASQGR
jgi:hypothetical protein